MPKPENRIDPRLNLKGQAHAPLVRSISPGTQVDRESGILRNVLLCSAMQPKGQAGYIDIWDDEKDEWTQIPVITGQGFIEQLFELSKGFREKGQKVRFGHPAMCEQEAGMHCGWVRNFRIDGDGIVGDIYLNEFSDYSPKGNLRTYVLKAAEEDPEALMMSIVFSPGPLYFIENGEQVEYNWTYEHDARIMQLPEEERALYETVKAWHYTDFVSEGANTNNLFRSVNGEPMTAAIVTDFLDSNPGIYDILIKSPEIVSGFMKKYEAHVERAKNLNSKKQMSKPKKTWLQRSADWLAEKMSGNGSVHARNIDATTADGVGITILTDADMPAVGDIVQVTETGEIPPAGVHTIAGGDLDGYQITTDEAGTITEVVASAPAATAEDNATQQSASAEEIRSIVTREVTAALEPLKTQLTEIKNGLKAIESAPLAKRVVEVARQTGEDKGKKMTAFQKQLHDEIHRDL